MGRGPPPTIGAHHGNIKDPRYGDAFFDGFDLVINALDPQASGEAAGGGGIHPRG